MLQAYEGYWDDGYVRSIDSPIKIARNRRVRIIVLDEQEPKTKTIEEKLAAMAEVDRLSAESGDEKLRIEDFPKVKFGREPINFSDEE